MKVNLYNYLFPVLFLLAAQSSYAQKESLSAIDSVLMKERNGKNYLIASATMHELYRAYIFHCYLQTQFIQEDLLVLTTKLKKQILVNPSHL